jgi:hypothetical protein
MFTHFSVSRLKRAVGMCERPAREPSHEVVTACGEGKEVVEVFEAAEPNPSLFHDECVPDWATWATNHRAD